MDEDLRPSSISTENSVSEETWTPARFRRATIAGRNAGRPGERHSPLPSEKGEYSMGKRFSVPSPSTGRRMSKAVSTYISPYSVWRNLSSQKEEMPEDLSERPIVENTYRMEPKVPFPVEEIKQIIDSTFHSYLGHNTKYNPLQAGYLTKFLSSTILKQIKNLNIERYKTVCLVNIGSKHNSSVRIASRCLWNNDSDSFASVNFENASLFASCVVYGIYFE